MNKLIYDGESEFEFIRECHENYRNYLVSIKDSAPRSAYEFASAEWHYDPGDRRGLHDASIISAEISYVQHPTNKLRITWRSKLNWKEPGTKMRCF